MELEWKLIFGLMAPTLSALILFHYVFNIFKGTTKPHAYTWYIWALTALVALIAQIEGEAGYALIFTAWMFLVCVFIGTISFIKFKNIIQPPDKIYLGICAASLLLIPIFKTPLYSLIIVCIVDFIGFLPTIKKSWRDPYNENALAFVGYIMTNTLAILALNQINFLNIAYPLTVAGGSLLLVLILLFRRRIINAA